MKKWFFVSIALVLLDLKGMAQHNLYFIMGHPFRHISTQFLGVVYEYDDSLVHKLMFSDKLVLLEDVKYYPEQNYLSIITHEHRKKEGSRLLKRLFTNVPDTVLEWKIDFGNGFSSNCLKEALIVFGEGEVYECFSCRHRDTKERKFFGVNIYTLKIREILPQDFALSVIPGSPGGGLDLWDIQLLYTNPENGKLVIPKTPIIEKRPPYPLVIPASLKPNEKTRVGVYVNNNKYTAINVKVIDSDHESIGSSHFLIFNKKTAQWHSWNIEGSQTVVRGFDEWVAGSVVGLNVILVFDELDRLKEKIPLNRISPGKEERRQKGTDTGAPFDFRADFFDLYYPGILFLHNIDTRETIRWSTGQGDCEILLVENEVVYYRINDEIYKAPILNGKVLGKSELLIKNEIVPDIHWAFISSVK